MSRQATCPSDEELRSLASGEPTAPEMELHVETCADCGRRLEEQAAATRTSLDWQPLLETPVDGGRSEPVLEHPTSFGEKYMVVGRLGAGGQGDVYRAVDRFLKRDVAIKWSQHASDAAGKDRLLSEGEKLARLTHPGIVRVYEVDMYDNRPYLVMEYAGRRNLRHLAEQGPLPAQQAAAIVMQLARALAYAHQAGVIHQDIKPENVLVNDDGKVQLADFGIARLRDFWNDRPEAAGTPGYMAPEQLRDPNQVSVATDVYGLGGVLFFLLTGQAPRRVDQNPYVALDQISAGAIDWKLLTAKKLPSGLVDVCRKALATDPGQRYPNAEAMARDLERFARPPSPPPWLLLGAIAACVAVLLIGAIAFFTRGNPDGPAKQPPAAAVQTSLVMRILREGADGTTKELHVAANKPEDWDRVLPIRSSDKIGVAGTLAKDARAAIFAVTLSASPCDVRELQPLTVTDGTFRVGKVFPLEKSPATEIILLCAANDEAPTKEAVAAILSPLPIWGAKTYRLASNQVLTFTADKVILASQHGRIGDGQDDPATITADALDKVRAALRQRYPHIAGLAFTHFPSTDIAKVNRVEGKQADTMLPEGGTKEEQELFHEVMARLLQTRAVRNSVPKDVSWPPIVRILPNSAKKFNAYAGGMVVKDKLRTEAVITEGYLRKVVKGNKDVLAAIMGHELVHLLKKHAPYKMEVIDTVISRDQEMEADIEGAKIAVAAGYLDEGGVRAAMTELQAFGNMPHLPSLKVTHPPWADRLQMLDRKRAQIWQSMAAFDNGHYFLRFEQYKSAESCFDAVTKAFSDSHEAWANLGYARLMQYCDALEEKDLRGFGIGQFAAGCFYRRPDDLVKTRGIDEKLWASAVKALKKVCDNDPDGKFVLARANLGLAYLVHPDGSPQAKEALRHFAAAGDMKGLDNLARAALLVNHAVAERAAGNVDKARAKLRQARAIQMPVNDPVQGQLPRAVDYNLAMLGADSKNDQEMKVAFADLEQYLLRAGPSSLWWNMAHDRYDKLGKELKLTTKPRAELARRKLAEIPRVVPGLELAPGKTIFLADATATVLKTLGAGKKTPIPVSRYAKLNRYFEVAPGIDLLAGEKVLSIFATSDVAPPVIVQASGLGAPKKALRVGMTIQEFKDVMKGQVVEAQDRFIDDSQRTYVSYPELGLAVRFAGDRVQEIAIVQIPRKST